ncbi:MAG: glycosyltransferase family 4 protein [Desulfobacterales bacterium]
MLHLVSFHGVSGVNSNLRLVAHKLKSRGWQPQIYHYPPSNIGPRRFIENGIPVNRIPRLPAWLGSLQSRWVIARIKQAMRESRVDLIHAHSFDADLLALKACAGTSHPVVVTCQSYSYLDWARRYADHYRKWKGPLRVVVSVTRSMAEDLSRMPAFDGVASEVIYNVPDGRFFNGTSAVGRAASREALGIGPEEVLITCTATFHPIKGHVVLADAFAMLATRTPHVKLALIGDTNGRADHLEIKRQVEASITSAGCISRVRFVQGCRDAEPVLRATDIYVQPSFMEALSVATAEAMAMQIPVVVSGVGGLREMVADGENGIHIEPGNVKQLAEALHCLAADPALRRRLGSSAGKFAAVNLSPDVAADRYAAVYERALQA